MKNSKLNGFLFAVFLAVFAISGCTNGNSGGSDSGDLDIKPGDDESQIILEKNINITGTVSSAADVLSISVSMTHAPTDEVLAEGACSQTGGWSLSVERAKLVAGDDYILTAANPANAQTMRSVVSGKDILNSGNSYSSGLTTISMYTEAACLASTIRKSSESILSFLKQSVRLTGEGLPMSTGDEVVDALAVSVKRKFNDTASESGASHTLSLLGEIINYSWPVLFVAGSETTIELPADLIAEGVDVSPISYTGPENVTIGNNAISVSAGVAESQGQVVFLLSLGSAELELTLPINSVVAETTVGKTLLAGDDAQVQAGKMVVAPDIKSFPQNTDISITQLDLSGLAGAQNSDISVEAAFEIKLAHQPLAPVKIMFQPKKSLDQSPEQSPEQAIDPEKIILIHVNSATKVETYVYPDSYDETNNRFTFTLESFSPIFIARNNDIPSYAAGSTITVSDLRRDSAKAFGFIRQLKDFLDNRENLAAIETIQGNEELFVGYLVKLSSKALSSFMALPASDQDALGELKNVTFKPQWYSLKSINAYDEYWKLRSGLMQVLYKIANSSLTGLSAAQLIAYNESRSVDIETDINAAILGKADADGNYYFPMVAYRVLNLGLTSPDDFFEDAMRAIDSADMEESEFHELYLEMADWIDGYVKYKLFTAPKVSALKYNDGSAADARKKTILDARNFFSDPLWKHHVGLWLGGNFGYSASNDLQSAEDEFAKINDALGALSTRLNDDETLRVKALNDELHPLGSSLGGISWVENGDYLIPPEVNNEIINLTNWRHHLISLTPTLYTWYRDSDGDGYGNAEDSTKSFAQPQGYVSDNTDTYDSDSTIFPGAPEICSDSVDNDQNGLTDEGCASYYKGTETTIPLKRRSNNQFLLPVDVGNQTLNLLVDTGSDALVVFADKLTDDSTVQVSDTPVSKSYASTTREGFLAVASVRVGAYYDADMKIMAVTSPTSDNDPSLTAKEADGIIGLRRTQGVSLSYDNVTMDAPLNVLQPMINIFELNLPPSGPASVSFGHMPTLDRAKSQYVFKAKTYTFTDPERPADASYADLQVPFRAKSKYGEANNGELDVLFDSGAVSKLVLDTQVAKALGYDHFTDTWAVGDDDEIEFNLVGAGDTITLYPKFKVSEISVAPLSQLGVTYEAVLGIDRWQHYIVGFSYTDYQSGGPDGTILMLFRPNAAEAYNKNLPGNSMNYQSLAGLNSIGDDRFPTADETGDLIAFQSNRSNGMGGWDIYVWKKGVGFLTTPNLNSAADDADPSISGDGRHIVFHSNRTGGTGDWDIYLYDLVDKALVPTPGLNSEALERTPTISTDGRHIAFRSERVGGQGDSDIYLYDRHTAALIDLPGLNTADAEYDPVVNRDGSLIAFDRDTYDDEIYDSSVFLYDVATGELDPLSDINSDSWEMDAVISPDGTYITHHTNQHNPDMEIYDRNFMLYNRDMERFEMFSALNSAHDEEGICFTGNGRNILFHSNRPGGMGGSDIYSYSLTNANPAVGEKSQETLPSQGIPLTRDTASDSYALAATAEDGSELTLLLDTGVSGIILFSKNAISGNRCGGPAAVKLPYGTLNAAEQICTTVEIGRQSATTQIPVIASQSEYNALTGKTNLPAVDGVIGFRGNFQNEFEPKILFMEFGPIDGEPFNLDLQPGFTLGDTPMTSLARGQGEFVFETWLDGVIDPVDPYNKSYTNMDVKFIARTDSGETSPDGNVAMLSSVLHDILILDFDVAESLGYSEITGWGTVNEVSLFFANDDYILAADLGAYPAANIRVADLSDHHCNAVLSADRWMGSFFVGFATLDFQFGGPYGTVSLLHVKDLPALQDDYTAKGRNYIALPGLNSNSDEDYPTVSIDGQTIAFQSARNGDKDVFIYRIGQGLLTLSGLNSGSDDEHPCISGDGRLVTFHSDRSGNSDVYLYDIEAQAFIGLPGLNTENIERQPSISADGTMLAFRSERPESIGEGSDIYLYSLNDMAMVSINGSWVNTEADELSPVLNQDATLLSFVAENRPDSIGSSDVFVYDLVNGRLIELPKGVNEEYWNDGVVGVDGDFIVGTYYKGETGDIRLLERSSGEFIYLPGLNTAHDEWALQVTPNAQFIVFESDRPGGMGGWDIYLYQRDETDANTYTVTNEYIQSGYAADATGNRAYNKEIRAYDNTGELIGTAITDGDGNFNMTIPQGAQLGIAFESTTAGLSIVTDDVGDDTYVPDFEAGNLKFTEVWIEDTAQAGLSSTIHFNIETTTPKYNTYVTAYLKAGNPGDVVLDDDFVPDYELTSLIIDKLGTRGNFADPVVKEQKDAVTSVTYIPDTANNKAYVEHTFIVPQGIPDGIYTAVFAINTYDVTAEDDAIQGESDEDLGDNYMVASASTIIGTPSLPNLRILSHKLYTNSFELPADAPDPNVVPEQYDLSLNLEVESMAQDAALPVDITFALEINGASYPMTMAESNGFNGLQKTEKQTYEVSCRPEDREGYPSGDRCASLFRQEQTGKTYSLFINRDAYDALKAIDADTVCSFVVTMDPDQTIDEYEDNLADNVVSLPVMFLAPMESPNVGNMSVQVGSTKKNLFDLRNANEYGNSDFGIGYEVGPKMDYMKVDYDGYEAPYAVDFAGTGKVTAKLFGLSVTPLEAGPNFDFDFSSGGLEESYFEYGVWTFGVRIWGMKHTMPDDFNKEGSVTLWESKDDEGNEKYAKRKEKEKTKTYMLGVIPVTVKGALVGEVGIRGALTFQTGNSLSLEAGPFASLVGTVEGGVGAPGFTVGAGVELTLIDIALTLNPSVMIKPEVPIAIFELKAPVTLQTLNGQAYLFARAFFWDYKYTIIAWNGYNYEILLFPLWYKGYGATDLYNVSYYSTSDFSGTPVAGGREGFLSHNWGYKGPKELGSQVDYFSAVYEGYFEFSGTDSYIWGDSSAAYGSDYTFYVNSDDNLTIKLDDEDILTDSFGKTQFTESIPAGFHKLTVNYNELHSPAFVNVYWSSPNQFAAFYYNNTDFSGDPVLFEIHDQIDEKWGAASPKPGVVNSDYFSVRYEGDFTFPVSKDYMFNAYGDDQVRIYVDDELILDNNGYWWQSFSASKYLTAGTHRIKVEYVETWGGAAVKVNWAPKDTFVGAYYNNRTFQNAPARISDDGGYLKSDPGLWEHYFLADFNYGRPASDSKVNSDNFSVRWGGAFEFEEGDYEFVIGHDDEISVWIDDKLLGSYSGWGKQHLVTVPVTAGWHIIRMSYVEFEGGASAVLKWGKKKKNIVTEYYGRSHDEFGDLIPQAINRRGNMDQNWGGGAPQSDWSWGLPGDDFQVIWEGDFDFEGAPYRFKSGGDDVVNVYLDNVKVVDAAWRSWNTFDYSMIAMNQGTHHVKAVFNEYGGGAWAKAAWEKLSPEKFYGKKFDHDGSDAQYDINTTGNFIDYNWDGGSPEGSADNFLIVWNGVFNFDADGTYEFYGSVDDDLHVYIDNKHVYHRPSWGSYKFEVPLKKGPHSIKLRYWEGGGAHISFRWKRK